MVQHKQIRWNEWRILSLETRIEARASRSLAIRLSSSESGSAKLPRRPFNRVLIKATSPPLSKLVVHSERGKNAGPVFI